MTSRNQIQSLDMTSFSREEILKSLCAECPSFSEIPEGARWILALWASGAAEELIHLDTGTTLGEIRSTVNAWGRFVMELSDLGRSRLNRRMLWLSSSRLAARAFKAGHESGLTTKDAIACLEKLPGIMAEMVKTERLLIQHEKELQTLDISALRGRLTQIKKDGEHEPAPT